MIYLHNSFLASTCDFTESFFFLAHCRSDFQVICFVLFVQEEFQSRPLNILCLFVMQVLNDSLNRKLKQTNKQVSSKIIK